QFELALQHAPDFGMTHAALGQYYFERHLPDKALPHLQRAVDLVPDVPSLRVSLAEILADRHDVAGAVAQLREGLRRDPDSWPCTNSLAWILATTPDHTIRNGAEALALAERLTRRSGAADRPQLSPLEEASITDTLAAAFAELGRFDEAIDAIHHAIDVGRS